jgi:aminoglycoside 6'-N-acetyltransferase
MNAPICCPTIGGSLDVRQAHQFALPPLKTPEEELSSTADLETGRLPQVMLRNATLEDLQLLLSWDEAEHVHDCSGDPDWNDWNWEYELPRKDLPWRYQLFAEDVEASNKPIGFVQIIDPLEEESHYWGTDWEPNLRAIDIWIGEEDYLNRGYGTQLMKQVLAHPFVFGHPNVTSVLIDPLASNTKSHRFYERLGFQPINILYFNTDR